MISVLCNVYVQDTSKQNVKLRKTGNHTLFWELTALISVHIKENEHCEGTSISMGQYHTELYNKQYHITTWPCPERATKQSLSRQKKNPSRSYYSFTRESDQIKKNIPLLAVKAYRGFSGVLSVLGSLSLECGDSDDGAGSKRFELACNRKNKSENEV